MTNLKIFLYSKATNLWQFYALSILLHHSGIVIFDDYPFPPFFPPIFSFSAPRWKFIFIWIFLKDHTARRMTKVLWDSWVISHVSNAREIRQYIGSRCVMCWRLDHYHHQLRIFTLWSFVTASYNNSTCNNLIGKKWHGPSFELSQNNMRQLSYRASIFPIRL